MCTCINSYDHNTEHHLLSSDSSDNMSSRMEKQANTLTVLSKARPAMRTAIIREADRDLMTCLCECCHNLLKGNVPLTVAQKRRLARYKEDLRAVANKSTQKEDKKDILQKGGFLPALLAPLLAPVIAPLAKKALDKIL